nr:MAG TPA: hypothetical protein [Caudoviricetes sp.]
MADSQAACTFSMVIVSPRDGFASFHTAGLVQSADSGAP